VLAGIGLAVGGWLANVYVASTQDTEHLNPWGSSPDLDPLWSTERTTLHLDGTEVTRTNKVRFLAASEIAVSRLKVCWREDIDTNCGQCEKCLRTQCALAIAGALERAQAVFEAPLALETLRKLPPLDDANGPLVPDALWAELCESFPDDPELAPLRRAACVRLPTSHPLATTRDDLATLSIRIEAPAGAVVSLLPESASDLLPAPITVRDGRSEPHMSLRTVEITWTNPGPGRCALPLRPPVSMAIEILHACRRQEDRPIPWCMISFASRETARLLAQLTDSWGQGVAYLSRSGLAAGDHGISQDESTLIQCESRVRVWWGESDYLDPFLVLESLRHGCLPLQCVPESRHDSLKAVLPPGLSEFTLAIPAVRRVPPISRGEWTARIEAGLSVLLAGNLERDLAQFIPLLQCEVA
jgi:hypothetical protein